MQNESTKDIVTKITETRMLVKLKKEMYEREPVFAASYKFTDRCTILIEPIDDKTVGVYFEKKAEINDLESIAKEFCNEVLDQQVRSDLERKYGNIRELIYQQAFSPILNLKEKIRI